MELVFVIIIIIGVVNEDQDLLSIYYDYDILMIAILKSNYFKLTLDMYQNRNTHEYNIFDFALFFVKRETNYNYDY